jgi:hypothetical protein
MKSWRCRGCDAFGCRSGQERSPPGMRGSAYREGVDSTGPGNPCDTAVATALPLYHTNVHLVRAATPFLIRQFYTFEACSECCLPLRGFPHKRCEG